MCKICGKYFRQGNGLRNHMNLHWRSGCKVNVCYICKQSFETADLLAAHFSTHSAEEIEQGKFDNQEDLHKCKLCGDEFLGISHFRSHMQFHIAVKDTQKDYYGILTGEKPFRCSYCTDSFKTKMRLMHHECLHTGERFYKCKFCEKSFRLPSSLHYHEASHTDERPFPCNICGIRFRRQDTLNAHMCIHTREQPTVYNAGDQRFTRGGDRQDHEQRHLQDTVVSPSNAHDDLQKNLSSIEKEDSTYTDDTSTKENSHGSVCNYQQPTSQQQQSFIYCLPCFLCDKQFESADEFNKHISKEHRYAESDFFITDNNPGCLT